MFEALKVDYIKLIESLISAEMSRDLEVEKELLSAVWADFNEEPRINLHDPHLQAQMLRICGFFLSNFGRARYIPNYQMRGKDLISRAIGMFEELGAFDKVAEAKCHLAVCYWREGAVEEAEIILIEAEDRFAANQLHPVYLQIQINRLIIHYWTNDFQKSIKIIDDITIPMEFCRDDRLQTMFHNQAGLSYWSLLNYQKSVFHFKEAERHALRSNNRRYIGKISNNLANTYRLMGDLDSAYIHIEKSIAIFHELGDDGWLASVFDTKAQILLSDGKSEEALETLEKALKIQYVADDAVSLIESLWTKCEIFFSLDRTPEGLAVYAELCQLATTQIGRSAVEKYSKKLADLVYIRKHNSLNDEVKNYKKHLIRKSLIKCSGKILDSAKNLDITHQSLSEMLHKQFPALRDEFNLNLRARRGSPKPAEIKRSKTKNADKSNKNLPDFTIAEKSHQPEIRKITSVNTGQTDIRFESGEFFDSSELFTFIVPNYLMDRFGIDSDALICVIKGNCKAADPCLILQIDSDEFDCGYLGLDKLSGLLYLENEDLTPIMPDEIYTVGKIIGYCPLDEVGDSEIVFQPIAY